MRLGQVTTTALLIGMAALPAKSLAGPNEYAHIALNLVHVPAPRADCTSSVLKPTCGQIVTHGALYPALYFAYVLITDGNAEAGIAGAQFGISYGSGAMDGVGVDIWSWKLCATLEFQQPTPAWPGDGGGNMVTWDYVNACQRYEPGGAGTGVLAVAGYFYTGAYSDAKLTLTARPVDGYAKVASCAAVEDIIEGPGDGTPANPPVTHIYSHLGSAGFGTMWGYSPCGLVDPTPVDRTTWSGVKALYRGR